MPDPVFCDQLQLECLFRRPEVQVRTMYVAISLTFDQAFFVTMHFQFGFDDGERIAHHTDHNQQTG